MKRPLWFLFLCPVLLFNISFAQTPEESVQLFQQALKEKNFNNAASHSYNAGKQFHSAGNIAAAKKYLNESVSYSRKSGSTSQLLLSTHLLGSVSFETADFTSAADLFESAANIAQKVNSKAIAMESLIMQARSLGRLKKYKRTFEPLTEALAISIESGSTSGQLTCYQMLAENHALAGNNKKAAEFKSLHQSLLALEEKEREAAEQVSSLQNKIELEKQQAETKIIEQKEKLQQTELILSGKEDSLLMATQSLKDLEEINEKRQMEIDLLNKEKELSDLRIQEQNSRLENEALLRNFILAVVLLIVTLIIVVVINSRKTARSNKKLDLQNKNIKSSINYAKRIQEAMLPKKEVQEKYLKDTFILFKPRDVVSGDFYWFSSIRNGKADHAENDLAFGAIDCTGHGVPGAFMSMIGINSLNTILNRGVTKTNAILDSLHQEIKNALQQEVTGNNDGMDAALCIYRRQTNSLEFSGAKNPLVYIKNGQVFQIKGDIHPIGGSKSKNDLTFKKHEITIDAPTMVYLFTDGFRDQFGGSENQKFMSKRFTQLLRDIHQLPMEEQKSKLDSVFEEWKGMNEQTDDVLVMGVRLTPNLA